MSSVEPGQSEGRVASLHLHPPHAGEPMVGTLFLDVVQEKGIVGNRRYFDRNRPDGAPSNRQISLIEREQISEHAATLGLQNIQPGLVRSNVETIGINLVALVGQTIAIGEAVLLITCARTPCSKMDLICQSLRALMEENRQGVLARVLRSGRISVGDSIRLAALNDLKMG